MSFLETPSNLSCTKIWKELTIEIYLLYSLYILLYLCNLRYSFTRFSLLYCVLCYITLHYKFNGQRFVYRSKWQAQSVCIFNKKEWFFQMKIKSLLKMITNKKASRLTKFGSTIHPKNGIIPLLSAYWKNSGKLVQ